MVNMLFCILKTESKYGKMKNSTKYEIETSNFQFYHLRFQTIAILLMSGGFLLIFTAATFNSWVPGGMYVHFITFI